MSESDDKRNRRVDKAYSREMQEQEQEQEQDDDEQEEKEGEQEFKNVPFQAVQTDYRKRKHKQDIAHDASRYDLGEARALSKRRRLHPPDEDFAGGKDQYTPNKDPDLYANNCYLCLTKTHEHYPRFYGVLAEFLGHAQLDTIVDMMYQVFDLFLNPHTLLPVQMTRAAIKQHVLHHMNEPLVEYYVQLQQYKTMRNVLADSIIQSNSQGDNLFDYKAITTLDKLNARIVALYKEKPREGLFANRELNIVDDY